MPENRKSVVVDIISDSKRFLSGFEEAIKAIEKTAKKTDILGGMKDDIEELRNSINAIEKGMSKIKPEVDDSAIKEMQSNIISLSGKIKTLKTDLKDIKVQVDTSTGEELVKLFNKLNREFNHIKEQSQVLKGLGIGLDTNNVNSSIEEINKLKKTVDELTVVQNELKASSTTKFDKLNTTQAKKKLEELVEEYNKLVNLGSKGDPIKVGQLAKDIEYLQKMFGKNIIPEMEIKNAIQITIEDIQDQIIDFRSQISKMTSDIGAEVSSFEVKDGKISVKLDLSTTAAQLKNTVFDTLSQVQESVQTKPLLVPLRFTSNYKTKANEELDELDKIAQGMKNSKAKGEITKQVENLRKQILDRDFKLEFSTNLPELLNNLINPSISEIQKVLKTAQLYLYPQIKLDEESEKAIKSQVEEISKSLKIDLGIGNIDLDSLLSQEEINKINEQFKKLQINISPTVDLTDKDVEKINRNLVSKLDKLHIEVDTKKLQEGLKLAVNTSLIDNWKSKFISAIDEVCSKIEKSFDNISKGQFYEAMKGWSEADSIMRDYRHGSSNSHGVNTLFEKNANGELERKAYANTQTGSISNSYIVDQFGSVSGEIKKQLKNLYSDVKKIGDIYDTTLHSHPLINEQKYDTAKVLKSSSTKNKMLNEVYDSILKQLKIQNIDVSDVNLQKDIKKHIISIYNDILSNNSNVTGKEFISEFNQKINNLFNNVLDNLDTSKVGLDNNSFLKMLQNSIVGNESKYLKTTKHAIGSDLTFSSADLKSYYKEKVDEGVKKLMIESNGKINELDLSQIDDKIVKAIITEYETNIKNAIYSDSSKAQYITQNKDGSETYDYSKRAELANKLLSEIIEQQIGIFNKKNKTNYSSNASDYLKQYDIDALKLDPEEVVKEQQEISKLVQLLSEMSASLTEINKKDFKLNTDSIDLIIKQIQSLLDAVKELGTQFKTIEIANFNISIEPFERIITVLQELSVTFSKTFNSIGTSKEEVETVSGLSKKLQDVIKKIKEKNELFEKEAQIVARTIPEETEKIGKLVSALNHIKDILENIAKFSKESGMFNLSGISELNKLKPDKLSHISSVLSSLGDSINNIDMKDSSFLSSIAEILNKADELKNLATVLKESEKKISEVNKDVKEKDKIEEKQLAEKYSILKDDLKEILRLTKEYEKADVYTKGDIKNQISQYQDRADTIQLEIWELNKVNDAEQNRVDILREQISLEESRLQNKEFSALERQEANADSLIESLREQNEYLEKDSNEWQHALELLSLYKAELKDVVSITRNVRLDESTGFKAISYKFASSDGSSKTVGANSNLLIDNTRIANLTELYAKLKKSINEYYSAQSKILKGDKSDKTQTESLQAYNTMLQVQKEIVYWKEKGLQPSEEQLLIEQRLLSITSTLKDQQKQSGLDNMYQTVLNTITRLNKKTKEVNELKIKSDGTNEFVKSIQNAQDNISILIGTLRGFKFSDFFSQDALQSFGLDGDALLFDNGDLNSLKWVINQLPLTEIQLQKIHDVLDDNVKITEKNVSLQNQVADKQKLDEEVSRKKEAAENLEMINNSLSRQYELTNKIHSLEQNGRSNEAKIVNDELVKEIRNCEALVAGYKTFDDVVDDVGSNLQQVFNSYQFDFDQFNARLIDEKEIEGNQQITKHNQDIIVAYKERNKQTKEYYELLEKVKSDTATDTEIERLNKIIEQWNKAINKKDEYNIQSGGNSEVESDARKVQDEFINSQSLNYSTMVDSYVQGAKTILNKLNQYNFTDDFQVKINEASKIINNLKLPLDIINNQESIKDIGLLKNLMSEINGGWKVDSNRISNETAFYKLQGKIADTLKENTAMSSKLKKEFRELQQEMERWGASIPSNELKKLSSRFFELDTEMKKTGKTGRSFFDMVTNKAKHMSSAFIGQYLSLYDFVRYTQQAYQYVAEIDKQMIELEKVSDMSASRLSQSFEHATIAAKDLGSTVSDVIAATADWSRLGYNADEAERLAEVATIYKNVGDGIDINAANESLISTLQGFQMEASQAMEIVDSFNEVANRMPIDSAGIGEALQRSAAAFNAANTDLNSSIALITATNSVLQNPEKVGRMWTTVSARIRGAKQELIDAGEETEGMVESTSKLRDLVKGATGFDIMADENTFKDMKEIIVGIGKEWDNLSDIDQAGLLEALAGKQQSNALAAALSNYEMIEEAYEIAENSSGSAMREQEKWEQGLEARTNKLKASLETLSTTFLDSNFLGGLIDAGRGLIDILTVIIDKLGVIPTLLGAGGGIFAGIKAFKGEGK